MLRWYEIAKLRNDVTSFLTDRCDVLSEIVPTGGDVVRQWVVLPGNMNVPLLMEEITLRPTTLEEQLDRVVIPAVYKAYFSYNANVLPGNRVRIYPNGIVYNVRTSLVDMGPKREGLPQPDQVTMPQQEPIVNVQTGGVYKVYILSRID